MFVSAAFGALGVVGTPNEVAAQSIVPPGTDAPSVIGTDLLAPRAPDIHTAPWVNPGKPQAEAVEPGVFGRARPDYEVPGIRVGGFILYPSTTTSMGWDTNVFLTPKHQKSDFVLRNGGAFVMNSEWDRNAFSVYGRAEQVLYKRTPDNQYVDGNLGFKGIVDVTRDFRIRYLADYTHVNEDRAISQLANKVSLFDKPIQADRFTTGLAFDVRWSRFENTGSVQFQDQNYDAATSDDKRVEQTFRNYKAYGVKDRLSYFVTPEMKVFGEVGFDRRSHEFSPFDHTQLKSVVGVSGEISRMVTGEIYVGYLNRRYEQPALQNIDTYTYGGNINWQFTRLLTLVLTGDRSVDITEFGGLGSYVQSRAGARLDYEIMENLILSGRYGYEFDDFTQTTRHDRVATSGINLTYLMSRYIHMSLDLKHIERQSDVAGLSYTRNVIGGTMRVSY